MQNNQLPTNIHVELAELLEINKYRLHETGRITYFLADVNFCCAAKT